MELAYKDNISVTYTCPVRGLVQFFVTLESPFTGYLFKILDVYNVK